MTRMEKREKKEKKEKKFSIHFTDKWFFLIIYKTRQDDEMRDHHVEKDRCMHNIVDAHLHTHTQILVALRWK